MELCTKQRFIYSYLLHAITVPFSGCKGSKKGLIADKNPYIFLFCNLYLAI